MQNPKQTTTGEVIHECGWLHPDGTPCPQQRITAAHIRAANMSACGKGLIIGSIYADEYVAKYLSKVK